MDNLKKRITFILLIFSAILLLAGMVLAILSYSQLAVAFIAAAIIIMAAMKFTMYLKWRKSYKQLSKVFDDSDLEE